MLEKLERNWWKRKFCLSKCLDVYWHCAFIQEYL